jgi:hypothetical protein
LGEHREKRADSSANDFGRASAKKGMGEDHATAFSSSLPSRRTKMVAIAK